MKEVNLIQVEATSPTKSLGCDFVSSVPQVAPDSEALGMQPHEELAQEQAELEEARSAANDRQFTKERVTPPPSEAPQPATEYPTDR